MSDRRGFVKSTPGAPPGFYRVEAAGLAWLAAAGDGAARVVTVLDVTDDSITLERLQPAAPERAAAENFGRALARTHAAGAAAFGQGPDGWTGDGFIGRQELQLHPCSDWGSFYAEQRLLPFATVARDRGRLSGTGFAAVERVCMQLRAGAYDDGRPPARLHGDLWAGNLMWTGTGVLLIDPAAHGGHPLTDLAMLHLFGAPHLAVLTAAYVEAMGWPSGWQDLLGLHQLHPLLVHAASHGSSYGDEAAAVAQRYG